MGVRLVTFSIPKLPLSLNDMLTMHWRNRSKEKEAMDWFVYDQWLKSGRFIFLHPIKIHYALYFGKNRRRDLDNYIGGTKYLTDAIKHTFITRDDNEWLVDIRMSFHKGEDMTVVMIEEAD